MQQRDEMLIQSTGTKYYLKELLASAYAGSNKQKEIASASFKVDSDFQDSQQQPNLSKSNDAFSTQAVAVVKQQRNASYRQQVPQNFLAGAHPQLNTTEGSVFSVGSSIQMLPQTLNQVRSSHQNKRSDIMGHHNSISHFQNRRQFRNSHQNVTSTFSGRAANQPIITNSPESYKYLTVTNSDVNNSVQPSLKLSQRVIKTRDGQTGYQKAIAKYKERQTSVSFTNDCRQSQSYSNKRTITNIPLSFKNNQAIPVKVFSQTQSNSFTLSNRQRQIRTSQNASRRGEQNQNKNQLGTSISIKNNDYTLNSMTEKLFSKVKLPKQRNTDSTQSQNQNQDLQMPYSSPLSPRMIQSMLSSNQSLSEQGDARAFSQIDGGAVVPSEEVFINQKAKLFNHMTARESALKRRENRKRLSLIARSRNRSQEKDESGAKEPGRSGPSEAWQQANSMIDGMNDDMQACQALIESKRQAHDKNQNNAKLNRQRTLQKQSQQQNAESKSRQFQDTYETLKSQTLENMKEFEYDQSADMWSESDASDYRADEKHIQMDNQLMDRLYKAATFKSQSNAPQYFKHRNTEKLSNQDRHQKIALKFTDWYLRNKTKEKNTMNNLQRKNQTVSERKHKFRTHEKLASMDGQRDEALVKRAEKIVKQIKVYEIGQKSHEEYFCHTLGNDPNLLYHRVVDKANEVILPLLNKIVDNKLILKDYTLDSGHLNGLASCLKNRTVTLDAVLFDNCGVDDEEISILLEGLLALDGVQHFVYKNNIFQQGGLDAIKPVLHKPDPHNLQELRLVNCATHPYIMTEMIQFMVDERVQIRSLSLVRMQISKNCLDKIAVFVKESQYMEDLDLSWNNFLPLDFCNLFIVLSRNITLRSLNLSCNTIVNKENQNDLEIDEAFKEQLEDYVFRRREANLADMTYVVDQKYLTNYPIQATYGLGELIRHNRIIQSVNLNNTGLNAQIMMGLMPSIKRARSLLCFHMASNPGISDSVIAFYQQNLKTLSNVPFKIKLESEKLGEITPEERERLSPRSLAVRNHKTKHYRNWKNQELDRYRNTRRLKPLVNKQDATLKTDVKDLSICRILNNEAWIPESGRWKLHTVQGQDTCWVCENWIFTLYFWNEKIGQYNERNYIGLDRQTKASLVKTVKVHNRDIYMNNGEVPVLFSAVNNWQPRPFMKLLDFINQIAPAIMPPFDSLARDAAQQHFKFTSMDNYPDYRKREVDIYIKETIQRMQFEWETIREANAEKFIADGIKYKKPALINVDQIASNIGGHMYVLPMFLPPGKNDFLIRTTQYEKTVTKEPAFSWYYRRYISDIRQESIPLYFKKRDINDQGVAMVKHKSIFKEWYQDTEETLERCFRNDQRYWKVDRICGGRDQAVMDIFTARYAPLKEIFTVSTIMNDTPPDFGKREFWKFCQRAGIFDRQMNQNIFDTYWKVTNFEERDQDNNDDNKLIRFEFFEILLRIAKGKYIDFGNETQLAYALTKLLQTYILPMVPKLWPLQSWRDEQLWTTEINEFMIVNEHKIWLLYDHIAKQKFTKVKNRLNDTGKTLVSIDKLRETLVPVLKPLYLTDKMIVQAFFLSKMTVANENDDGNYEYTYLHRPEFLEFIGRLAWLKYLDTYLNDSWPLIKKIRVVITVLFSIVGEDVQEPPELEMVHSDSDNDY